MDTSILIAGVGGQGTLLASRILGNVATSAGLDVKVSEVHGMSQRGGSVTTYVKYSDKKVNSPIISESGADFVLAFELLEGYRNVNMLKNGGRMITNSQQINPMPVITGAAKYPEAVVEKIEKAGVFITALNAAKIAENAGNQKAINVVLIGVLAQFLNFPKEDYLSALKNIVPAKLLEVNLRAFEEGYKIGEAKEILA